MESLIEWFYANRDRMPQKLGQGDLVVDAGGFTRLWSGTSDRPGRAFGLKQRLIGLQGVVR